MDYRSSELVDVIRRVRNRWRLKLALRGAVVVAAGTVLALLLSASGLESFRFSAPAIVTFRIVTVAVFVGLLFYGLVWPLRRRVTDAQVAMYLEECDPTLEAAIISAVEATANGGSEAHSPKLVEKLTVLDSTDFAWPDDDVRAIPAPMLIVLGDSDGVTLDHAVEMFKLRGGGVMADLQGMPESQLAVLPGTSHFIPPGSGLLDRSEWLLPMIETFLAR